MACRRGAVNYASNLGLGNPPSTCTHGPPASILAPQVLRQVYQTEIRRDLVEDIKSEASGMYEKVR
jgi:hypothetical protein